MKLCLLTLLLLLTVTTHIAQAQERLQITASFSILADVVNAVAGDAADVSSLIPIGADPHTFSPTPQDLIGVADADIVLISGINFEEGLTEAVANAGTEMTIVEVSDCINIYPVGASLHQDEAEQDQDQTEASNDSDVSQIAERCAAYYAELGLTLPEATNEIGLEDDEEHAVESLGLAYTINCGNEPHEAEDGDHLEGSCDPHVWTNPENVMLWTLRIRDVLSEIDPSNTETYTTNAAAYVHALQILENTELLPLIETLPINARVLVTNHETLGYFAVHYGFELVGVVFEGATAIAEPSAAEIASLVDTIRAEGVAAIFAENTSGDVLIQRVAEETGVAIVRLYSDSLGEAESPAATYIDYMRYNVQSIVSALTPAS